MTEKFYVYELAPNNQVVRRHMYVGTARGAKAWEVRVEVTEYQPGTPEWEVCGQRTSGRLSDRTDLCNFALQIYMSDLERED